MTPLTLDDFDYPLPPEAIARYPLAERDQARMLVMSRAGDDLRHHRVIDLPECLNPGDLLVLNNVRVMPCRLLGYKLRPDPSRSDVDRALLKINRDDHTQGSRADLILLEPLNPEQTRWQAFLKPAKRLPPGTRVLLDDPERRGACVQIDVVPKSDETGENLVPGEITLQLGDFANAGELLEAIGQMPLPPYLGREPEVSDKTTYQTNFFQSHQDLHAHTAREGGRGLLLAQAAPTAGLHFTPRVFEALSQHGIQIAYVTLAVGAGTFLPVKTQDIQNHKLHAERFFAPAETLNAINHTRCHGGRVIAVGTTVVRTLEAIAQSCDRNVDGQCLLPEHDQAGASDLFIRPGFHFRVIDGLLTNFHLPKSTLLMLVSAFVNRDDIGRQQVLGAYEEALQAGYRFFSYGDCMLIL